MEKEVYYSISNKTGVVGVANSTGQTEQERIQFMDQLFDNGYTIKQITKKEYDEYNEGDELSIDDILGGNYLVEN